MAHRKKEDWLAEADRLGLDVSDMDWPTLQRTVSRALKKEEMGMLEADNSMNKAYKEVHNVARPTETKGILGKTKKRLSPEEEALKKFAGQEMKLAPEIAPSTKRALHYREELGDELIVEEKHFDIRGLDFTAEKDAAQSGTYYIKGKTGEKTIATSAIPKEQPALYFRPSMDYAIVVEFKNRVGYLWTHQRLLNIKAILKDSGYYEEYKHLFKDEPNIWYSCGLLCCDVSLVHHIFKEIEEKERIKRERGY